MTQIIDANRFMVMLGLARLRQPPATVFATPQTEEVVTVKPVEPAAVAQPEVAPEPAVVAQPEAVAQPAAVPPPEEEKMSAIERDVAGFADAACIVLAQRMAEPPIPEPAKPAPPTEKAVAETIREVAEALAPLAAKSPRIVKRRTDVDASNILPESPRMRRETRRFKPDE